MHAPESPVAARDLEREPTLFLVYTVHLDTQWRWTVRDTIRDFIPATLEGNFELFADHPARILSFEGAFRYRLIEEYYPEDFARLKEWVDAGNWRPAGTMLDSPDVNCVAPESLLRHILYARRYFEGRFGDSSRDLFLPDCFGFGHAVPSIAAHCGLLGFSAQKFGNWGGDTELPFHVGRWLGPDGEGVVAALRPEGYGEGLQEDLSQAERWLERIERQRAASGLAVAFMYVGLGDRGGRLGEDSLAWIERSVAGDGPLRVVQTASDTLFRTLEPEQVARLPRHQGELLLPTHGTGCWTSQAAAKHWNRACELTADTAERAAAIADWLGVMTYPAEALRDAWRRFLWHQMHDDLTGTSIPEAYRYTWNDQLIARNCFDTVLADAGRAVGEHLDTRGTGLPVVLFNPLAHPRCDLVEAMLDWPEAPLAIEARGPDGERLPVQIVERTAGRLRVVFAPPLPALGFTVWRFCPATEPDPATDLEVTGDRIANRHFELTLADGWIAGLRDRASGEELLAAPLALELLRDRSTRWPAWEIHHRDVAAEPTPVGGKPRLEILEAGPVRATVEITRTFAGSTYRQRVRLGAGATGRRIELDYTIDWGSRGRLLKLALRQPAGSGQATYGLGCGTIRRGVNTPDKYEVPGLWAAHYEGGVALLAERHAGWDRPDAGTLRLSLLRSPGVGRKFRHQGPQDHGTHRLRCALARHTDTQTSEDHAAAFAQPPVAWQAARHPGALGRAVALLELGPGATLRALKKPEEGPGLVARVQESGGHRHGALTVNCRRPIARACFLDGCEAPLPVSRTAPEVDGERLRLELTPSALRTLRLEVEAPAPGDPATYAPLALPFDRRLTSAQGEPLAPPEAGPPSTLPAELWPDRLQAGAVPFELGPADAGNALICGGQTITWPEAGRRLWLLAASLDRPRRALFTVGRREVAVRIDHWSGIIGRFKGWRRGLRHLQWARPGGGFVRSDTLGWVATHRHDAQGADLPYEFGYLFRYEITLRPGDRVLRLPELPEVVLFAATVEGGSVQTPGATPRAA